LSEDGIFHRDISTGNLMLRRLPGPEGKIQGVLSDFDLAVDMHDPDMKGNSHLHRTGTLPFLSMSLLKQLDDPARRFPYIVRFDLESCIYVFLWDSMFHPEGRDTPNSRLKQTNELLDSWLSTDPTALYKDKYTLLDTFADKYLPIGADQDAKKAFPHLFKCQPVLIQLLSELGMAYLTWKVRAATLRLDHTSPQWRDLCGHFKPSFVLEQFKAMQEALWAA
jgi:Fungal protein kinase